MAVSAAELSDETRVSCRAFMRERFKNNDPPVRITMGRAMGDGGGYGFNVGDILALLNFVQTRLRGLPKFEPHETNITIVKPDEAIIAIAGGGALPRLVSKTLSEVADHAVKSIAASLKAAGVEIV